MILSARVHVHVTRVSLLEYTQSKRNQTEEDKRIQTYTAKRG